MASKSKGGGRASDYKNIMQRLSQHLNSDTLNELFHDDFFITDIIKVLYEDALDPHDNMEILSILEQEVSQVLNKNSVDQVITALTNMFSDIRNNSDTIVIASQILITVTTIFIDHDEYLESELCINFISVLMDLLKKVNNVSNRRLRAIACQCLSQIEAWKSGVLWKWKDTLNKLAREERTDVCQDYIQLLVTIMNSSLEENRGNMDSKDVLPVVSYAMENTSYLSTPGILAILHPVIKLVQNSERISPTIFKPLMLQYLPCVDLNVTCLMLHIQNEFRGEILSLVEEKILLRRITEYINNASFPTNSRLLTIQWLTSYIEQHKSEEILHFLSPLTVPSVFHPLDIHTNLLALHSLCKGSNDGQDISKDLYYLTQLAETTGGIRVTSALYYILYLQVNRHSSEAVHVTSLKITKSLFQSYPHLIPLIVDFLQSVKTSCPETMFHGEILNLLHKTVLSLPLKSLLNNYQNYLQVWILSAKDPSMYQQKQLRRLLELVQEASRQATDDWALGTLILSICRCMMLHHHTDTFYPQMGDLLYFMMHHYGELDTRDHSRFYYALLTLSSDDKTKEILSAELMAGLQLGENIANIFPGSVIQSMPLEIKEIDYSPITLERSQIRVIFEEDQKDIALDDKSKTKDFMELYRKKISSIKSHVECHLSAYFIKETDYNDLIAVSFHICDKKNEALCEDINFSVMLREVTTDVMFKLRPDLPVPISLHPSAIFSHERITFQCNLNCVQLGLEDFIVPFPWHLFNFSNKRRLFDALWQDCTAGCSGTGQGVESVKIMKCEYLHVSHVWKKALLTEESYKKSVNRGTDCYLFFMPPSYHLLFQADARTNDTVLKMASDFPPVLRYLDDYLEAVL